MDRPNQESGDDGQTRYDRDAMSETIRRGLDDPDTARKAPTAGGSGARDKAPKTGALRNISKALGGED